MKNKNSEDQVIYLITLCTGRYDDYFEQVLWATSDKDKATKYINRFNLIVEKNTLRIMEKIEKAGKEGVYSENYIESFWESYLIYDYPKMKINETKLKN